MAIDWQAVLVTFGGNAVLLGAGAWLAKALISNQLSKDAEAFRIKLQAQTNVEIERLKASFQIAATEHEVRFSKLHEKRGIVIEKLYQLLLQAKDVATLVAAHPKDEEYQKQAWDQHLELYRFFHLNKIYLPSAICGLLNDYESKVRHSVVFIRIYMREEHPTPQMVQQQNEVLLDAWRAVENELPAMMADLEKEFRRMLGVEGN